jgi:hypothetical protein
VIVSLTDKGYIAKNATADEANAYLFNPQEFEELMPIDVGRCRRTDNM